MTGLDKALMRLQRTALLLPEYAAHARDDCAERTLQRARAIVPVRTGRLRASLTREGGRVLTRCEYAPYVELGTVRMAARPYLLSSLRFDEYLQAAEQAFKEVL